MDESQVKTILGPPQEGVDPPSSWLRGAIWALGITISGALIIAGNYISHGFDTLQAGIEANRKELGIKRERVLLITRSISELAEHQALRDAQVDRDFARVDHALSRLAEVDERLRAISTNASARHDPFTGTQGRELRALVDVNEKRIDVLERAADKAAHCCEDLKNGK